MVTSEKGFRAYNVVSAQVERGLTLFGVGLFIFGINFLLKIISDAIAVSFLLSEIFERPLVGFEEIIFQIGFSYLEPLIGLTGSIIAIIGLSMLTGQLQGQHLLPFLRLKKLFIISIVLKVVLTLSTPTLFLFLLFNVNAQSLRIIFVIFEVLSSYGQYILFLFLFIFLYQAMLTIDKITNSDLTSKKGFIAIFVLTGIQIVLYVISVLNRLSELQLFLGVAISISYLISTIYQVVFNLILSIYFMSYANWFRNVLLFPNVLHLPPDPSVKE